MTRENNSININFSVQLSKENYFDINLYLMIVIYNTMNLMSKTIVIIILAICALEIVAIENLVWTYVDTNTITVQQQLCIENIKKYSFQSGFTF